MLGIEKWSSERYSTSQLIKKTTLPEDTYEMSARCPVNIISTTSPKPIAVSKPIMMRETPFKFKKKEIAKMPISGRPIATEIKVIDNSHDHSDSLAVDSLIDSLEPLSTESGEEQIVIGSTNGSTSGYGSEGYVSAEEPKLKTVETLKVLDIRDEDTHCARCHKTFDPLSGSNAEKRCLLPHPTKMVIPIRRDGDGTHFVCLCCRTEFKLPKMTFYEAGVNSMLTGYCFIGQHTSDENDIDCQYDGGAALTCEEAGCIEFFV